MLQPTFIINKLEEKEGYSKISLEPLEKGYGNTLGVALRRVLLSSIEGAAVTQVVIDGVQHQFTTLSGMKEDIVEFILNVKQLHFSIDQESFEKGMATLSASGPGDVYASQIELPAGVTLTNPNMVLATLADKKTKLQVELQIERGMGYQMINEEESPALGVIPVDAAFSPISKVAYKVEATRVGRRTDLDKLVLEIWTTGSLDPVKAIKKAAKILVKYFTQVYEPVVIETPKEESLEERIEDEVFRLTVEELDLPTRIANALRKGGYETVKDLTHASRSSIAKVKNLGEKSVDSVITALEKKGVTITLSE